MLADQPLTFTQEHLTAIIETNARVKTMVQMLEKQCNDCDEKTENVKDWKKEIDHRFDAVDSRLDKLEEGQEKEQVIQDWKTLIFNKTTATILFMLAVIGFILDFAQTHLSSFLHP